LRYTLDPASVHVWIYLVMKPSSLLLILAVLLSSQVLAQAPSPIVDLNSTDINSTADSADQSSTVKYEHSADKLQQSDQYYRMQILQDEVRTLRGMLEEINYQLQQIKQRQMDDYLDIDRRLISITLKQVEIDRQSADSVADNQLGLGADSQGQATEVDWVSLEIVADHSSVEALDLVAIKADYDAASGLLLKNRDLEGAILAFQKHIDSFPDSPYAANAHYWLGEIYLLQEQKELSLQSFRIVVDNYADHSKAMDARFKLGKLYHKSGQAKRAKALLETAARSSGGAAAKAKAYLEANAL